MDREESRMESRSGSAPAEGQGHVGAPGAGDQLGEAIAAFRVPRSATAVGGRADILMVRPEQAVEQRLCAAVRDERGEGLRGDDVPDSQAISPGVSLFRQFLRVASAGFGGGNRSGLRRATRGGGQAVTRYTMPSASLSKKAGIRYLLPDFICVTSPTTHPDEVPRPKSRASFPAFVPFDSVQDEHLAGAVRQLRDRACERDAIQ